MRQITWEWLAGFFDGEGNVTVCSNAARAGSGQMAATVSQAGDIGRKVILAIRDFLTHEGIKTDFRIHKPSRHKFSKKDQWVVRVSGPIQVKMFLERLLPYLVVKKLVAQDVLRFIVLTPPIDRGYAWRHYNQCVKEAGGQRANGQRLKVPTSKRPYERIN